jgi:Flp pilus assembly protein TadG
MEFSEKSEWRPRMRNSLRSTLHRLGVEVRGAEIAEAAAVLPLMFMMLLGIFWFGQAFSIYGAITRAAQEGARAGAAPYCTTCANNTLANYAAHAVSATQTALTTSKLDPTQARYPSPNPTLYDCLSPATVKQCSTGGSSNLCVQAPVVLATVTSGATGVCGISVSFQYPFQFWLPFTSLNQQKIYLNASARVRMETP